MRFFSLCAVVVCLLSLTAPETLSQRRQQSRLGQNQRITPAEVQLLRTIKQANMPEALPPNALTSYRMSLCIGVNILVPSSARNAISKSPCVKGQTGILAPSSGYVKVGAGNLQLFQVVNKSEAWQFVLPITGGFETGNPTPSKLDAIKLRAMKENVSHSLLALYQLLNSESWTSADLKVTQLPSQLGIRWTDSGSVNEFFFDRQTLLCSKGIRSNQDGVTVFTYSNYKSVDGVMLPHTIGITGKDGKVAGTQNVEKWSLAVAWPDNFFTPQEVVKSF